MSGKARPTGRRLLVLLLAIAVGVVFAVLAVPTRAGAAGISVRPGHGPVGTAVTVSGSGFGSCAPPLRVSLDGDDGAIPNPPSGTYDGFSVTFTVPRG